MRTSVDRLADVGAALVGIVLNAAQTGSRYGYGRYGASANSGERKVGKSSEPQRESMAASHTGEDRPSRFRS